MRRALLLATAALAALTGLVLFGAAISVRPPGLPTEAEATRDATNRALASAFYDAVNTTIAGGDPAPLKALLGPGYVEHGVARDAETDGNHLVRRLLAIHTAAPDVRLGVEALAADGDLVVARVRVSGGAVPLFLGLALDTAWTPWGPVDVFRVENGRIVERWGPASDPAPPPPELRVTLEVPSAVRTLAVSRVTLEPGAHHASPVQSGPRLIYGETGTVVVEVDSARGDTKAPPITVRAGEHLPLSTSAGYAARNVGLSPARFLDVAIAAPPLGGTSPSPVWSSSQPGVTVDRLADDLVIAVPAGPIVLSIGRATLGPGERLAWAAATGPVLLHADVGEVDLTVTGSASWVRAKSQERTEGGVAASLSTGGGALLEDGAAAEVRTAPGSEAVLLVLTLLPAEGQGADAGAARAITQHDLW